MKKLLFVLFLGLGSLFSFAQFDSKSGFINFSLGPAFNSDLEVREPLGFNLSVGRLDLYGFCSGGLGFRQSFLSIESECSPFRNGPWSAGFNFSILIGADLVESGDAEIEREELLWKLAGGGQLGLNARYRVSPSAGLGVYLGLISATLMDDLSAIGSNVLGHLGASFRVYF